MTDESRKVLKENKRLSKDEADNLECTIKIRQSTVDTLKEIDYKSSFATYDSAINRLIKAYEDKEKVR